MGAGTALRQDYDAMKLRDLANRSNDANQTRRLLALAVIYEGGRRTQAAKIGGMTLQVIRDWVLRFNAQRPGGLIDRKAPGAVPNSPALCARLWRGWSMRGRSRRCTEWCAGGSRTWCIGYTRSSA